MAYGFKTGGRQKGTPNKNTEPVGENLRNIFMDELESGRIQEALYALEPRDYIAAILKLSPYMFSKARPADSGTEPHAPDEPQVNNDTPLEEPQPENAERPKITAEEAKAALKKALGGEMERFRIRMGWNEEQLDRFVHGEPVDGIGLKQ